MLNGCQFHFIRLLIPAFYFYCAMNWLDSPPLEAPSFPLTTLRPHHPLLSSPFAVSFFILWLFPFPVRRLPWIVEVLDENPSKWMAGGSNAEAIAHSCTMDRSILVIISCPYQRVATKKGEKWRPWIIDFITPLNILIMILLFEILYISIMFYNIKYIYRSDMFQVIIGQEIFYRFSAILLCR